jgi:hypothetical protein
MIKKFSQHITEQKNTGSLKKGIMMTSTAGFPTKLE